MGKQFIDKYTLSHLIAGIIFEKMQFTFYEANIIHMLFELFENYYWVPYHGGRCVGISLLPNIIDCKNIPDSPQNSIGDQLAFAIGFKISKKYLKHKYYLSKWTWIFIPIIPLILSLIFTYFIGENPIDEYDKSKPIKYII